MGALAEPMLPAAGFERSVGYALIAALILVVMASLAAVVAVRNVHSDAQRERERELLFVGGQYRDAIAGYHAIVQPGGVQQYPQTLDELLLDPRFAGTMRHLRRLYPDPMTGKADWDLVLAAGRIVGVKSRSTAAPLLHSGFSLVDAGFEKAKSYQDWTFLAAAAALGAAGSAQGGASAPPLQPPPPHIDQRIYCYNTYLIPQTHCTDDPPPTGNSVESCIRFYSTAYNQCIAAIPAN